MNKQVLALMLLTPFVVLTGWSLYYLSFTRQATEVVLPIRGYDPRNLLSGHYIQFQIDWSAADCHQADWNGNCPKSEFKGVDRYYVSETEANRLERKINSGVPSSVVFAYYQGRRPIAKDLIIGNESISQASGNGTR